eukprot:7170267-Alexandrium_andersonii.AAC.1
MRDSDAVRGDQCTEQLGARAVQLPRPQHEYGERGGVRERAARDCRQLRDERERARGGARERAA